MVNIHDPFAEYLLAMVVLRDLIVSAKKTTEVNVLYSEYKFGLHCDK